MGHHALGAAGTADVYDRNRRTTLDDVQNSPYEIEHVILALFTIILAWLLMHTVFALHYAHDFYIARSKGSAGGLEFPQTPHPTYADFYILAILLAHPHKLQMYQLPRATCVCSISFMHFWHLF